MKYFALLLMLNHVLSMAIGYAVAGTFPGPVDIATFLNSRVQVASLLVLPFLETAVLQMLVIEVVLFVLKKADQRVRTGIAFSLSAFLFFYFHYRLNGAFNGISFGAVGGVVFAFSYLLWRPAGRQQAFFGTWMLHAASNAMLLLSFAYFDRVTTI